jgi:protein O-mannosyl-transferase
MTHAIFRRTLSPRAVPWLASFAAATAHLGALGNGYPLDDATILGHPLIQSLRTLPAAAMSPWWYESGRLYRPVTLVTLGLDRALAVPAISHGANVALHAIVAALLARLCLRWLAPWPALAAALLFALLPVHAEAVSTIVGRAELLSALALVGLMLLVTRREPPTPIALLGSALLGAAALGAKESGAAAPFLALAAAYASPTQRVHAWRWASRTLAGTLVVLMARAFVLGTLGGDVAHPFFRGMPPDARIGVALSLLPRTAAMLLLPIPPAIEEVPPLAVAMHPDALLVVTGALLVLCLVALLAWHARRPSALTLGACILVVTAAPTSNLLFAEGALTARTLYAPSLGAAMMAIAAIAAIRVRRAQITLLLASAAACLAGAVASWRETRIWRDTPTVAAAMVARRPANYRGHEFLAYAARDGGRLGESKAHFGHAIALFPRDAVMLTDAATVALRVADTTTATNWLDAALRASSGSARARTRLHGILLARGDSARARELLVEGLRIDPAQRTWSMLLALEGTAHHEWADDARAGTRTRTP